MNTDTAEKILAFIKHGGQVTAKQITDFLGFTPPAIFRQLKKLLVQGKIEKTGLPPKVFYHLPIDKKEELEREVINWATNKNAIAPNSAIYCNTIDIFKARQDRLPRELISKTKNEQLAYLLSAAVGEIGNNSFDHNFGNWPDLPGVYFQIDLNESLILLADRGNGVFNTLKKVKPNIKNDIEALTVAFTQIISGRAPEQRGNGLKFVCRVAGELNLKIKFYSGNAVCKINSDQLEFLPDI